MRNLTPTVKFLSLTLILIIPFFLFSFSPVIKTAVHEKPLPLDITILFPGVIIKTDAITGNPELTVIPLKRVGKLLMIEARIDNETGNFIFDTGASQLVLNSTYFRKYFTAPGESGGITGSAGEIARTIVKQIQIPGLQFKNITANVANLGHLENRRGVKVLGLFGLSLLKNKEIVIDLLKNELYIYSLDKNGQRLSLKNHDCKADLVQKIEIHQDVLFVKAFIGGKILNFCLDTGAESNVISAEAPKKVLSSLTILQRSNLKGAGATETDVLLCSINDLTLGNQKFSGMQAIITDLEDLSTFYGYSIDGMLGYDFFEKGRITLNMKKLELKLCLNKPGVN
jgi:predicted aspartyl protease